MLVCEYADGGSLSNYLETNFENLTGNDKLRLAKEIVNGVMCLHSEGIIHRDLVSKLVLSMKILILCTDNF